MAARATRRPPPRATIIAAQAPFVDATAAARWLAAAGEAELAAVRDALERLEAALRARAASLS